MNNNEEPKIIKTDEGALDGQNKCPQCGATDIGLNVKTGKLRCNYCRHEFEPEKVQGLETNINELQGEIIGSGTSDIIEDEQNVRTFKCTSCGAEVVIDTSESTQARCHWCRNTLSVNSQIPNGVIPDVVLPFNLTKAEAKKQIEDFVGKRKFYAHPQFVKEFTTDNVMGVYFPYMVVDINSHAMYRGRGEREVRRYYRKRGDRTYTYYDADLYDVSREFDLAISGLTVESSQDKLKTNSAENTNNVINAIMPFDTENCVKYNANYLKGFTSQKRDTNIDDLRNLVDVQSKDIARFAANESLKEYDRGVCWQREQLSVKGKQWKTAYLPVWLYSYQQTKGSSSVLHYVAVNARTKETMGSVPIHMPKLFGVSILIEILAIIASIVVDFEYSALFWFAGFIYFFMMLMKYRNHNARHFHETETKKEISNLTKVDKLVTRQTGLSNPTMEGANNTRVSGQNANATDILFNTINNIKNI